MRIDLKALLLISLSAPPDSVIRMNKRFQVGKASFMVRYELRKGDLIIHQMKKVRGGTNPDSRPKKRQRRQQRKLESGSTCILSSNRTSLSQCCKSVSTDRVVLVTNASQTSCRECNSIQIDTSDLTLTYSKDQQTASCEIHSSGSQTEEQALLSRTTQAKVSLKSWSTQTMIRNASLGSQTEIVCSNVGVQSVPMDGNHQTTQTDEVEEELFGPYLQALTLESIKNMSNLIRNDVICAISQVLDIRGLEIKQMSEEQDLPREGALEPLTPLSIDQFDDKFSSGKFLNMAGIKGLLSTMTFKAWLIKAKKLSAGHSWNCTMKCMYCDQRNRISLSIDTQSTQTEGREEHKESEMAKFGIEMATQTEKSDKERSRWTLKRI